MFNMNMNQQGNNNVLLRNNADQLHKQQIMQIMEKVWQTQNQPELSQTLCYLGTNISQIKEEMQRCIKTQGISQYDQQFMKQIRDRCIKLKRNNEIIMTQMLNLKSRMSRIMHITIQKDNSLQSEYNVVQERIRRKKLQITNKLQQLKNRQMLKKTLNVQDQQFMSAKKQKQAPLKVALTELKDAAEIVNRELIEQRQQIKCLIQELYQDKL